MRKTILILLISLIGIVGYGQIVIEEKITVETTLLTIDGVVKGHLWKGTPLLPALMYEFVAVDTLDWTTMPIGDLIEQNDSLVQRVAKLEAQIVLIEAALFQKLEYGDIIMLGTPNTEMGW